MKSTATGTIDHLPSGRWRLRMVVKGKRETFLHDTKAQAEEEREAMLHLLRTTPVTLTSIGEWFEEHLRDREESKLYRDADGDVGGSIGT
jgi:hypothetical protein